MMRRSWALMALLMLVLLGCSLPARGLNRDAGAPAPLTEPDWVRNGEPMEMENDTWYPADEVERFLDGEMFLIGKYQDVEVFVERTEVKPYARLYTRFDKGRYRAFEPRN